METQDGRNMGEKTMTDEERQIERVARAICRVKHDDPDRRMPLSENPPDGQSVWTAYRRQAQAVIAAISPSNAEPVRAFAKAVLHGDDEHKAWLLEASEAFIAGEPLPAPRGKGTQSDAEPVAWRWRYPGGGWAVHTLKPWGAKGCIIEPLYTLEQSDAEPVAWRYKYKGERGEDPGDWFLADKQEIAASPREQIDVQPLYTTPPRPDVSAADYGSTK
jgi:hypothetical protein